jgi:3-hydroxyacyl-CoA dehydrogenase / enoyl-CoA hydratase / 3-hydroxybutyryl-CoA epimerase
LLLATIDMPGRAMNVFSEELMDALEEIINRVDADPELTSVVITSGKSSFLAGADLPMVRGMTEMARHASHAEMFRHCGRIGRLFLRIEQSAKPWVAAVNGTALGGGLELAMACRTRFIAPQTKALIGLPEVKLGLLPGAGGTQRLPRLVGLELGLDLLLSGRSLNARESITSGLFEAASSPSNLVATACASAKALACLSPMKFAESAQKKFSHVPLNTPQDNEVNVEKIATQNKLGPEKLPHYPAYRAIIRSVLLGGALPLPEACDLEMNRFLDLMFNPVADRMISTLFIERQRVEKAANAKIGALPLRMRLGPQLSGQQSWQALFEKNKLGFEFDPSLTPGAFEFKLQDDQPSVQFRLFTVDQNDDFDAPTNKAPLPRQSLILSDRSEYGQVIECLSLDDKLDGAICALGKALQCFVLFSRNNDDGVSRSILRHFADSQNQENSLSTLVDRAHTIVKQDATRDFALLDVACVLSGLAPAYTGGPFSLMRSSELNQI